MGRWLILLEGKSLLRLPAPEERIALMVPRPSMMPVNMLVIANPWC